MDITDKIITIIFASIIIFIFATIIFFLILFPPLLSQQAIEKDFMKNYDNIMIVTDYLVNSEYNDVWIHSTYEINDIFVNKCGDVIIDDSEVIKSIKIIRYKFH